MSYRAIHTLDELQTYLSGATHVAFDFETASTENTRKKISLLHFINSCVCRAGVSMTYLLRMV